MVNLNEKWIKVTEKDIDAAVDMNLTVEELWKFVRLKSYILYRNSLESNIVNGGIRFVMAYNDFRSYYKFRTPEMANEFLNKINPVIGSSVSELGDLGEFITFLLREGV